MFANGPGYATLRLSDCFALKRLTAKQASRALLFPGVY
jgi:hypothetical protein